MSDIANVQDSYERQGESNNESSNDYDIHEHTGEPGDDMMVPYRHSEEENNDDNEESTNNIANTGKKGKFNWHTFFIVLAVIVCAIAAFFLLVDVVKPIANVIGKTLSNGIKSISKWFAWLGIPGALLAFGAKIAINHFRNKSDDKSDGKNDGHSSGNGDHHGSGDDPHGPDNNHNESNGV